MLATKTSLITTSSPPRLTIRVAAFQWESKGHVCPTGTCRLSDPDCCVYMEKGDSGSAQRQIRHRICYTLQIPWIIETARGTGSRCEPPPLRVLRIVIDQITGELARVNDSNEIDDNFDVLGLDASIKPFAKFYNELCQIIQSGPPFDPAVNQTDTPSVQTALPPDLRHSSPSTASTISTASAESTYEYHTHSCANAFLFATLQATEVEKHCWWSKPHKIRHTEFFVFQCVTNHE
jgi:hypothetical protein